MLVAVVVPNEEHTEKWAEANGHKGSFSELCALPQLKNHILLELKSAAEKNKVNVVSFSFYDSCCLCFYVLRFVSLN